MSIFELKRANARRERTVDTPADDGDRLLVSADMQATVDELYDRGLDGADILAVLVQRQHPGEAGPRRRKASTRSLRSH